MPFSDNKTTSNAQSIEGQLNTPITKASQPGADRPLSEQLQTDSVKIQSVSKDQVEFYQLSEDDMLLDASIEARPLMMNESYKIKVRDPGLYAYYWGEYRAKQGLRFSQLKAMGFVPASPSEILEHQGEILDGKIVLGDVMLMRMSKNKYVAHIKNNLQKSNAMLAPQKAMEQAKSRAGTLVTGGYGMPSIEKHKGEFFIPNSADVKDVPVNPQTAIEQKVYEQL